MNIFLTIKNNHKLNIKLLKLIFLNMKKQKFVKIVSLENIFFKITVLILK